MYKSINKIIVLTSSFIIFLISLLLSTNKLLFIYQLYYIIDFEKIRTRERLASRFYKALLNVVYAVCMLHKLS